MPSRSVFLLFFVNLFVSLVSTASLGGSRLLAILEDVEERENYSQFFGDLEGIGDS
jgi:oligosaccharyltransferase complex subunit beta